jgi:glycogen debranching enzyme
MPSPGKRVTSTRPPDVPGVPWPPAAGPAHVAVADFAAPPAPRDIRETLVVKEGDLFFLTDVEGNVPERNPNGLGLYLADTRFLSRYELVVEGLRPTILLSTVHSHFLSEQVLTNPNLRIDGRVVPEQTIGIRRYRRLLPARVNELLTFVNYNGFAVRLRVALHLDADFADMFEVRGIVQAFRRERRHLVHPGDGAISFRYDGADGVTRETELRFEPPPTSFDRAAASYDLELPARGSRRISADVAVREGPTGGARAHPATSETRRAGYERWFDSHARVETSSTLFDAAFRQARLDLRALLGGEGDQLYAAAGVPWYATLFGRDSLITALLDLWSSPALARHTLQVLARLQGERDDPSRDEEPGKIMHELRRGELARLGLVPFAPYYGTIDATPLFIVLLSEYYRASGDLDLVRALRPNLEAALTWIERSGDLDGDGFVEYRRRAASGLDNQGWKDSWDGIVDGDGSLPEPPIALVEVQGYVYAAFCGAAALFRDLGDEERARRLDAKAVSLREAFNARFWMEEEGFYCLALDGKKRQVRSVASNPAHALFAGIVLPERGDRVARRLLAEDLFTGWGIRTLSSRQPSYNPAGYHVGSVWPHDNAIAALGLKRYGHEELALEIASGLFDACRHFPSFRLPELFCGFARSAFGVPVRYPVACSPQAWSSAAPGAFLPVMLGLQPDGPARELRIVRPLLPPWLSWVKIERLPCGAGEVDLRYERIGEHTSVDVTAMRGDVRVAFVRRWEEHPAGAAPDPG